MVSTERQPAAPEHTGKEFEVGATPHERSQKPVGVGVGSMGALPVVVEDVVEEAATSAARAETVAVPLPVGGAEGCAEGELKDDSITVKKQQL